jgi:hypothetical protein
MSQSDQEHIQPPGTEAEMTPQADHGETSYRQGAATAPAEREKQP